MKSFKFKGGPLDGLKEDHPSRPCPVLHRTFPQTREQLADLKIDDSMGWRHPDAVYRLDPTRTFYQFDHIVNYKP